MKRNKELYFDFNSNKTKLNLKSFRSNPVNFKLFKSIVSELKNINIKNIEWLNSFYSKYKNYLFPDITSHIPNEYSKYFWNSKCLNLDFPSSSNDFYIARGWSKDEILELRKSKYATGTRSFQKNKYNLTEKQAKEKLDIRQSVIKENRQETYKKYLKEDPDYFKKKCGYSIEHFIDKGFNKKEAKRLHKKSANEVSIKNKKWAKEQKELNPEYWNSRTETQLEYWINKGYNKKEAKEKLKERQTTFSKDICIEKHGKEKGLRIFNERQEKWKLKVFNSESHIGGGRSMISEELFTLLLNKLGNGFYKHGKHEKFIRSKNAINTYKYDFTDTLNKKIIEFNCDYWHCNPSLYESTYIHPVKKMSASEIWEYDEEKIKLAESHGYEVLNIWEGDYRKDPETIVNKCVQFLSK